MDSESWKSFHDCYHSDQYHYSAHNDKKMRRASRVNLLQSADGTFRSDKNRRMSSGLRKAGEGCLRSYLPGNIHVVCQKFGQEEQLKGSRVKRGTLTRADSSSSFSSLSSQEPNQYDQRRERRRRSCRRRKSRRQSQKQKPRQTSTDGIDNNLAYGSADELVYYDKPHGKKSRCRQPQQRRNSTSSKESQERPTRRASKESQERPTRRASMPSPMSFLGSMRLPLRLSISSRRSSLSSKRSSTSDCFADGNDEINDSESDNSPNTSSDLKNAKKKKCNRQ